MDHATLGAFAFDGPFFLALISIIFIDIVLAGDNSVVIAMAVRSLPPDKRKKGILLGALVAVLLRIIFTFFASKMLLTPLIKLTGGSLILWIAVKLLLAESYEESATDGADTVWGAMWIIIVADLTMSLDNVLAVGGASKGNLFALLFGLGLSIPLVVFTSTILSRLMDRFPVLLFLGAAVLGKVGGQMIFTDPWIENLFHPSKSVIYAFEILTTAGVIGIALYLRKKRAMIAEAARGS